MKLVLVITVVLVAITRGQYIPRPPTISLMQPVGLRMSIPDERGMTLFAVHYSINKPLRGVEAGDWNFDVRSPRGNEWVHENTRVFVKPGDTVYYWTLVMHNGIGRQLLDQSWIAGHPTAPPPTGTPPPTPTATAPPPGTGPTKGSRGGATAPACTQYPCLIFEDNFDSLDLSKWKHEITAGGGGNWEFQYYTNNRSNSYVRDGNLYIKPTLTSEKFGEAFISSGQLNIWGHNPGNKCTGQAWYGCERQGTPTNYINPIQSARMRTAETFNYRYGRVEVEAKVPAGDWIWPAIWLLPTHQTFGDWPASGEIDIMESRGNRNLRNPQGESVGCDRAGAALHFGPFDGYNAYEHAHANRYSNYCDAFHKYRMDWDPNGIEIYYDDVLVLDVKPGSGGMWEYGKFDQQLPADRNVWVGGTNLSPFDQEFYLILNVAVGGTNGYFSDSDTNTPYAKPWSNQSPTGPRDFYLAKDQWYPTWNGEDAAMQVNYVKVWKMQADS